MSSILGEFAGLGGGSIGRATVDMVLNNTAFNAQLAETEAKTKGSTAGMQKGFKGFADSVRKSFSGAQLAMVGLGAVAAIAIVKSIGVTQQWASEVRSLQRVTGQTAEQASALASAGEQLGIDVGKLNIGFGLLSKNIVNGAKNLEKYGVITKDTTGAMLPFDAILANVSDKFLSLPAGPEQAAFAMNVFGRSGKNLIPILQKGSAGLAELEQKAKDAGLVMSQDDLTASKNLSVAQRQLGEAFKGAAVQLGKEFIPALTSMVKGFTKVVELIHLIPAPLLAVAAATAVLAAGVKVATAAYTAFTASVITAKGALLALPGIAKAAASSTAVVAAGAYALGSINTVATDKQKQFNEQLALAQSQFKAGNLDAGQYAEQVNFLSSAFGANRTAVAIAIKSGQDYNDVILKTTANTNEAQQAIHTFAAMSKKDLSDWRKSTITSITDTFNTLGTKTKDIFNVTQHQLDQDFQQMLNNTLRFKRDLAALLSLKPGTLGLSKTDTQQFESWMIDRGPAFVDAFVRASKAHQREWVAEWKRNTQAIAGNIRQIRQATDAPIPLNFEIRVAGGAGAGGLSARQLAALLARGVHS